MSSHTSQLSIRLPARKPLTSISPQANNTSSWQKQGLLAFLELPWFSEH